MSAASPFDLDRSQPYQDWRAAKLARRAQSADELLVEIADPFHLSDAERAALLDHVAQCNMALYRLPTQYAQDKAAARALAAQLGLHRLDSNYLADEDGLSSITPADAATATKGEYIPYTTRPINWHTDGYYNVPERNILGMLLHCAVSAETGGENALLDHELAYIHLRDANPDFIRVLSAPDAMTIPPRTDEDGIARAEQTGPVFHVDPEHGFLHMRYTARTKSIAWKEDTRATLAALATLLASDSPWILRVKMEPAMGLVCNNVLHTRGGFSDSPQRRRLLYRGRYYDRIDQA
jgi:alpha-ketoglutarate-dependent taurine dioxygenase